MTSKWISSSNVALLSAIGGGTLVCASKLRKNVEELRANTTGGKSTARAVVVAVARGFSR